MDTRMSLRDTTRRGAAALASLLLAASGLAPAQTSASRTETRPDWRRVGSTSLAMNLSAPAGGLVDRVWFDAGGMLFARTGDGRVFATRDYERWEPGAAEPPADEAGSLVRVSAGVAYRGGAHVWRSEDGGLAWRNMTEVGGQSLLGGRVADLAVDPTSGERVAVAAETGVWLTVDGGRTWTGLNEGFANMPVRRLLAAPRGSTGVRAAMLMGGRLKAFEWRPGDNEGWGPVEDSGLAAEEALRREVFEQTGFMVSAAAARGEVRYAGTEEGRLVASLDGGRSWRPSTGAMTGRVERFWVHPGDPRTALAIVTNGSSQSRLLRTVNGGAWWEDLTANLGETRIYGVTAHAATGAIYVATAKGVFWTVSDLQAPSPASAWQAIAAGWSGAKVYDVRLDDPGNLLIVAVEGEGVFSALGPHRMRNPVLVDSADGVQRAVAPGSLVSLLGGRAEGVTVQGRRGAVLAAQETESQIQLPYSLAGTRADIEIARRQGRIWFGLPLKTAAPAIVVGRDGAPMVLDAESGLQLDALNTARGGMRLQILMAGLGRVTPDWPVGLAAPLADPPRVAAPLKVFVDRTELVVERATLAPGYIGYYLVEVRLPEFLPAGAVELSVEASGEFSNRVRLTTVE